MRGLVLLTLTATLLGCAGEPPLEAGRPRPLIRHDAADLSLLGHEALAHLVATHPTAPAGPQLERLKRVGERLAAATFHDHYRWSFTLFDRPKRTSVACLPGGRVVVFSGLLDQVKGPDELAAVLAHAIAHATLRHADERLNRPERAHDLPPPLKAGVWAAIPPQVREGVLADLGLDAAPDLAFELEADDVGLIYLKRAGFRLVAAAQLWKRLAALERPTSILRGDPAQRATRAANLDRRVRELEGRPPATATPKLPTAPGK